jgi:hypothetical protein
MRYEFISDSTKKQEDKPGTHYNEAPLGWREITIEEFGSSAFFSYSPKFYETRQILRLADGTPTGEPMISANLYFLTESEGFALSAKNGHVRFFRFGCEHRERELSQQDCLERKIIHHGYAWHVYECEICGRIRPVDSSD